MFEPFIWIGGASALVAAGGLVKAAKFELIVLRTAGSEIGSMLRRAYQSVIDEGSPPEMLALIDRMDGAAR